jgi:hypothetical protein
MKIIAIIWLRDVVDKLSWKHNVSTDEVEQVFNNSPRYRFIEKGDIQGEDVYAAMGRTEAGRLLIAFFVYKGRGEALIVSARDMSTKERKHYGKK